MDFKHLTDLEAGQKISVTIYRGTSPVEAKVLFEYLDDKRECCVAVPLGGTNFKLLIEEVKKQETPGAIEQCTFYEIFLRGELK